MTNTPTGGSGNGLRAQALEDHPTSPSGPRGYVPMGTEPQVSDLERVGAGPSRFQTPREAEQPPSIWLRLAYLAAILAIVVGIPAVLWFLSGPPPIPTSLPTREDLTQSIGIEQILTLLVAVVWLAWLQFVACLVVELLSAVRGGGVPSAVPLSGPSQRLARMLVGGVLLAGVIGGQVAAVVGATSGVADRSASSISASATHGSGGIFISPAQQASVDAENLLGADEQVAAATPAAEGMVAHDPLAGQKVYTVKPAVGHYHDNLWDIAERHLGDGRRYTEIFELNKDRDQPGGQSLHLAKLIQPGWQLVMPDDAVGVARVVAPQAPAPTVSPTVDGGTVSVDNVGLTDSSDAGAPQALGAGGDGGGSGEFGGSGGDASVAEDDAFPDATVPRSLLSPLASDDATGTVEAGAQTASSIDIATNPLVAGLASGGLFAATLAIALAARRARSGGGAEPGSAALEAEVGLLVGADTDRAAWLDRALRGLTATCAQTGITLPPVHAVILGDDRAELHLSSARADAPQPWTAAPDGRTWFLDRGIDAIGIPAAAPYPALVCIGRDERGRDVLIDLEAAEGPVQVTGDPNASSQVASAIAVQLSILPWSDEVQVRALGLPATVAAIAGPRLTHLERVDQTVTELESSLLHVRGQDVLGGRVTRMQAVMPHYLVSAEQVSESLVTRISALAQGGRQPFGAVMVGSVPGARWRLEVDGSGSVRVPLLGLDVRAHRLLDSQLDAVAELFTTADRPVPRSIHDREKVPSVPYEVDDVILASTSVAVSLVGRLVVRSDSSMEPSRVPLAEEIVAYLACQPGGTHPGVLAGALWPRGVTHTVATATIERVRDWLGDAPDGSARLREDADGRLHLSPDVAVDWYAVCALVTRSRHARTEREEADLLRRALRLARGPFLQDRPQGRYAWVARTGLDRTVPRLLVDAAHRLVELAAGDPVDAAVAARVGLRVDVTAQMLWRDLLEVQHRQGGAPAAAVVVGEMQAALDQVGVAIDAETEALIEHLTAGAGQTASA